MAHEPLAEEGLVQHADDALSAVLQRDQRAPGRHAGNERLGAVDRVDDPGEAGIWPLVPVFLSEDAVAGARLFDQRADRGFGLAVGHRYRRVTGDVVLVLNRQRLPEMAQDDGTRRIRKLMYQREIFAPRLRFLHFSVLPPATRQPTIDCVLRYPATIAGPPRQPPIARRGGACVGAAPGPTLELTAGPEDRTRNMGMRAGKERVRTGRVAQQIVALALGLALSLAFATGAPVARECEGPGINHLPEPATSDEVLSVIAYNVYLLPSHVRAIPFMGERFAIAQEERAERIPPFSRPL